MKSKIRSKAYKAEKLKEVGICLVILLVSSLGIYQIIKEGLEPSGAEKRAAAERVTIQAQVKEQDAENARDTVTHQWFEQKIQQHEQNMRDNVIIAAELNAEEAENASNH